ncbi:hypothetical protein [Anatilimnocola aggregata]|uniref:hypothetical protein n=1 Tax=Anatilimnocola aggregata TaxID=2528021 RepID=UPI0011A979FE|nr:hypothetical protein [Anatilimnocola aggregata]
MKKGRTTAREPEKVKPVPDEHVDAVLPLVSRQVAATDHRLRRALHYSTVVYIIQDSTLF